MNETQERNVARIKALIDKGGWMLIALGAVGLAIADYRLLLTLLEWSLYALVIGGLTIIVSRITFPQIKLSRLVERAQEGDMPAAVMVAALLLYCALVFIGIVMWAK